MADLGGVLAMRQSVMAPLRPTAQSNTANLERRLAARHEFETVLTARGGDGQVHRGFCRNISANGMAAFINAHFSVGDQVYVALTDANCIGTDAVPFMVRHRIGFRYGLELAAEAELRQSQLQALCDSLSDPIEMLRAELSLLGTTSSM